MASLAEMQQQLEKLRAERARGVSRISIQSPVSRREVEYRSDAELAAAIGDLEGRIAAAQRPAGRIINPVVSKGY